MAPFWNGPVVCDALGRGDVRRYRRQDGVVDELHVVAATDLVELGPQIDVAVLARVPAQHARIGEIGELWRGKRLSDLRRSVKRVVVDVRDEAEIALVYQAREVLAASLEVHLEGDEHCVDHARAAAARIT